MDHTDRMKNVFYLMLLFLVPGMSSTTIVNITATVGQKLSLPCVLEPEHSSLVQMQWQRLDHQEPIVVYNPNLGGYKKFPNTKGQIRVVKYTSSDWLTNFYLDLDDVEVEDSGDYVCDINTFPSGTVRKYVNLVVKGEDDTNTPAPPLTAEVSSSLSSWPLERSTSYPATSSAAWRISVTSPTSLNIERTPAPSDSPTSSKELKTSSVSLSFTTSTKSPVPQDSMATVTQVLKNWTEYKLSTLYDEQNVSLVYLGNPTKELQTLTPTLVSEVNNNTAQQVEMSTQEEVDLRTPENAHETTATVTSNQKNQGSTSTGTVGLWISKSGLSPNETTSVNSERYLPVFIILPTLVLFIIVGILYSRYLAQKRMDLPPPFKPPPPPVKYTSVRNNDILMTDLLV